MKKKKNITARKLKHLKRIAEMQMIVKADAEGKCTPELANRMKKYMILERGRYDPTTITFTQKEDLTDEMKEAIKKEKNRQRNRRRRKESK